MSHDERWNPDKVRVGVARNLRAIVELYEQIPDHAQSKGDPDGEAVLMLGHVANPEAFNYRLDAAKDASHAADQFEADLLFMLASWEDMIREERDQPTDLRATVQRAADYLRDAVTWMLSDDEDGNTRFLAIDQMAADLARVRSHLENVLKDGIRSDKGVPCMTCGTALVKVWGADDDSDRWHCRRCEKWSTLEQYRLAVRQDFLRHADWLSAEDMATQWRVAVGTVRQWGNRGYVGKRKNTHTGRIEYRVADVLDRRNVEVGA